MNNKLNKSNKLNNGVSLITLIVTIIIIIILAGIIMLAFSKNNPITEAKKAKFINDVSTFVDELEIYKATQYASSNGSFIPKTLNAYEDEEIYPIITSLEGLTRYKDKFQILEGKLVFRRGTKDEDEWVKNIPNGVEVVNKPLVSIVTSNSVPVKAGNNVDFFVDISSDVAIKEILLENNLKIVDDSGIELIQQPTIILGNIEGNDKSKNVTIEIDTTNIIDGNYKLKMLSGTVKNLSLENDEVISLNSFEIDNTAPDMPKIETIPEDLSGYLNTDVVISISKINENDDLFYSIDGTNYIKYISSFIINNNTEIYAKEVDKAENSSNVATLFITNIDKSPPAISVGTDGGTVIAASTAVTAVDIGSAGLSSTQYVWSTSQTEPTSGWTTFVNNEILTYSTNGTYYLWIKAIDRAGNTIINRTNAFIIDSIAPTAPIIDLNTTAWTNQNVIATITYPADSEIKQYSIDGSNWYNYTSDLTINANNTTIYARAHDLSRKCKYNYYFNNIKYR